MRGLEIFKVITDFECVYGMQGSRSLGLFLRQPSKPREVCAHAHWEDVEERVEYSRVE